MITKLLGYVFIFCITIIFLGFGFIFVGILINGLRYQNLVNKRELWDDNTKVVINIKTDKDDNDDCEEYDHN